MKKDWTNPLPVPLTICDEKGIILYMNPASVDNFKKDGGAELVGKNLLDCHPEPSRTSLRDMLKEKKGHTYLSEKDGVRKLIHEAPWYENGSFKGLMELIIPLPDGFEF
jgi:transcriptional regulator with PAS, ATPase and Fis domain